MKLGNKPWNLLGEISKAERGAGAKALGQIFLYLMIPREANRTVSRGKITREVWRGARSQVVI